MNLDDYIQSLIAYKGFAGDIVCHKTIPAARADFSGKKIKWRHQLTDLLKTLGIKKLYRHQIDAMERIRNGQHTVVATPTASGKTLIYNLPVIETLLDDPDGHALYLFPLKALARDQLESVRELLRVAGLVSESNSPFTAAAYDGDVSAYQKTKIRRAPPHVLLSNPEMLHLAMLAHHHLWEDFFANLKYIVVDEVHTYRGVMGSNMAWVFRRLLRICRLYGSDPVFVFCSATIANPGSLVHHLTGLDARVFDASGAPAGTKHVIMMRGLEGAAQTAIALIHSAVHRNLRTIVYTQSRKITELIAIWASQRAASFSDRITAYRAGFLPEERREIEKKLASGELLAVVSTSALELGIDIGNLDLCVLVGYPGTMMSTWQRAGRVGRDGKDSALILVAHEDALDQYFINHPDVFFDMPPEKALINPANETIVKNHLECAAAELPLEQSEVLLEDETVKNAITELEFTGRLLRSKQGNLWYASRKSPHRDISLRGTGKSLPIFIEKTGESLGDIDRHRSFFETHEGAVYLHRGESYIITRFDHEKGSATARQENVNYYTRARSNKSTTIIQQTDFRMFGQIQIGLGILEITEQVTGFDRRLVANQRSIGVVPLDLPKLTFKTQGLWIVIPDHVRDTIETQRFHFMGGIHALEHAAIGIMPLLVMTDRNDLGGISIPFHPQIGKAAVFIYDGVPGGLGLSGQAFERADHLLNNTLNSISSCPCDTGCPACVHSPKCGSGNRPIDKVSAHKILELMMDKTGAKQETNNKTEPGRIEKKRICLPESSDGDKDRARMSKPGVRYGVLDIETRRSAKEVGGWNRAERMGVSCAVVYDSDEDDYVVYQQDEVDALCDHLKQFDLVIGFNIIRFDYKVLSGLVDFDFHGLPTLDLLLKVHETLGYRLPLDHLAKETLGQQKSADGLQALEWWKQGRLDDIIAYCKQDVRVTREIYLYGRQHGYLIFRNKAGHQVRVPVSW